LIYLPGVMGTFVAISPEESELQRLRDAANEALAMALAAPASPLSAMLQPTGWDQADRRIFVTGPGREHRQQVLRYVLPVRSLALVRQ